MFGSLFDTSDPKFWVSLAFVLLVVLAGKTVAKLIAGVLDGRGAKIKSELDAAEALRKEAEAVLASYKQKQAEFTKEAEEILAKARSDAAASSAAAEAELKTALDNRMKNAMEKIAQEEAAAIAEVRSYIVELALAAAHSVVVQQAEGASSSEVVRLTLADIERKIH